GRDAGEHSAGRPQGGRRRDQELYPRAATRERRRPDARGHRRRWQRGEDQGRHNVAGRGAGGPQAHLYHPPPRRPHRGPEGSAGVGAGSRGRLDGARGRRDLGPTRVRPAEQRVLSPHVQRRPAAGYTGRKGLAGGRRRLGLPPDLHPGPHPRTRRASPGLGRPALYRRRLRVPTPQDTRRGPQGPLHRPAARETLGREAAGGELRDRRHGPRPRAPCRRSREPPESVRALPIL
ncbi:MAG: Hydroxyacylglutathione hydrolase, partial [uncultured Rubrobacteraceae bacterium]